MLSRFFKNQDSRLVSDIKQPQSVSSGKSETPKDYSKSILENLKPRRPRLPSRPKRFRKTLLIFVVAILSLGILAAISFYRLQEDFSNSLGSKVKELENVVLNFDLFRSPAASPEAPPDQVPNIDTLENIWSDFSSLFRSGLETYKIFQGLLGEISAMAEEATSLMVDLPSFIFAQKGEELVQELESINARLEKINRESSAFRTLSAKLKNPAVSIDFYLPFQLNLIRFQKFTESILAWLKSSSSSDRHVLILLGNPSEMRPAGGFVGSYADLSFSQYNLRQVEIRDINDPDRELDLKVIPPKPIQVIVTRWKAADSNWFFDFPASASKIIDFLESSRLYKNNSTTFDGAIAISSRVVSDILNIIGPIEVAEEKVTIDKNNFLTEIQKQVQTNRAKKDDYPKRILKSITPIIFERLGSLGDSEEQKLLGLAEEWFAEKDMMFFFKDEKIQNFFTVFQVAGNIYELPQDFYGDYLAFVSANLGGGKSDLFIEQKITLNSQLDTDGTVSNHLVIERKHNGHKAKYEWYKIPNQSYLQVFTPLAASLENSSGGIEKKIKAPLDYSKNQYLSDPLVNSIEATEKEVFNYPSIRTMEQFGKNVFTTWSKVNPGEKTTLALDYRNRLPFPPRENTAYQFVFEKQAGSSSTYRFELSAPVGFVWQENNLPVFEYVSSDPPGRLIIILTLKKS